LGGGGGGGGDGGSGSVVEDVFYFSLGGEDVGEGGEGFEVVEV